ncbi:UPF0739 protein C1orf74 homolog isoform X2 [Cuculus canorus]|uniref:UPF0739 protein C1orf74 homolog isoform X2 n=1 Tax=Cuculus canorus TaxID=55661 RepID=UPI0023AB3621|nr:UPF0739 protein C1orf74 homolog isoform X2 [Cuculus canorus]
MSGRLQALRAAREELGMGRKCRLPAGRALQLAGEVLAVAAGLKPALLCDCGAAGVAEWRRYLGRLREAGLLRGSLHLLRLGGSALVLRPELAQRRVGAVLCAHPAPFIDVSAARRSPALCGQEEAEAIRGHLAVLLGHLRATCPMSSIPASSSPASSIPASSSPASSSPASSIPASSFTASSSPAPCSLTSSCSVPTNPTPCCRMSTCSVPSITTSSTPMPCNTASSNPMPSNAMSSNSVPSNAMSSNSVPSNAMSSNPMLSHAMSSSPTASHSTSSNPVLSNATSSCPTSSGSAASCPTSFNSASSSSVSSSEVVPTGWNLCTIVGVLLGYPAAYTFATEEGGENCLAMTLLRVFTVQAACPRIKDGLVVQIYSFSIPESLCTELKELLDAWCEELKEAFRVQSDFVDLRILSELEVPED